MAEMKVTLERLNDFNWASWKFRMELLLMKENVWSTVTEPKPAEITSAWTRGDEKARATIGLALEDNQLCHIIGTASAKEMWEKLKGYHERGSLSNKIHVLRKLCSMRLTEGGNMSEHLVQVSELVHRLASMGEPLKEHLVVAILLSSLPESFNPLVTALEGRPEEDLKLDYVKGKLLDEWRRKSESRVQEVFQERVLKAAVQIDERRNFVRVCYHCKKEGHFRRNCHVLMAERQRNQTRSIAIKETDPDNSGTNRGVCFTTTTTTGRDASVSGQWIIDTGCTKHMTGSTVSFDGMTFCEEKVSLADGRTLIARGIGNGRIVGTGMDGESVDMQLKELLYVPGLSSSVLSVSRITSQGYDVLFGLKDCRIMKHGKVIAVGSRSGGLYYLRQPVVA